MTFELPQLPYDYTALEPAIDAATMEVHYEKHHKGYTDKLNAALEGTELAGKPIEVVLGNLSKAPEQKRDALRNNGGGYYNHCLFWRIMSPESAETSLQQGSALADAIERSFDTFDTFKERFAAAAASRFGSGWAWLCRGRDGELLVTSTPNQDNPLMDLVGGSETGLPILGLDVWEHAYYLHYQNRRADYIRAWWNVVNWKEVADNYDRAEQGESMLVTG